MIPIKERPKNQLFAIAILPQLSGGWHQTRMLDEATGKTYIKQHKWDFCRVDGDRYKTNWYKEEANAE